jgi:hypothetical protein
MNDYVSVLGVRSVKFLKTYIFESPNTDRIVVALNFDEVFNALPLPRT